VTSPTSWPPIEAFRGQAFSELASDGAARCVGLVICGEDGRPSRSFFQGASVDIYCEFQVDAELETPIARIELYDAAGQLVHGRTSAQLEAAPPETVAVGSRLQVRFVIGLELGPGRYSLTVGLSSVDPESYAAYCIGPRHRGWPDDGVSPLRERWGPYRQGPLTEEQFLGRLRDHCRIAVSEAIVVGNDDDGRRAHSGLVNLPGSCRVDVPPAAPVHRNRGGRQPDREAQAPTIVHVTHPKAGSQWIAQILADCAPERIVAPRIRSGQLLFWAVQPGMVYPTVYLSKQQFDTVRMPENSRVFVVVRDPRDALISLYFSFLKSHGEVDRAIILARSIISRLSLEEGLVYLMDGWLSLCAQIQLSWKEAGYRLIRYEDLIENDLAMFEELLIGECQIDIAPATLRSVVLANRFERYTNGRQRGQEETGHHYRKGIAGDWFNHFTPPVKQAFKARYGGLLVEIGYERDLDW
jgi:hypothetical protein